MSIIDIATKPLRQAIDLGGKAAGQGFELVQNLRGSGGQESEGKSPRQQPQASPKPKDLDDTTITRKAEQAVYAVPGVTKGKIDVNTVDGTVFLRGTAKNAALIRGIEAAVAAVPEVKGVENLLHLPKTPARKQTPKRNQMPRKERTGLNADKTVQQSEDLPEVLAKQGKGRQPAKLGAEGGTEKSSAPDVSEKGRFGRDAGAGGGVSKKATTGIATENGPKAGAGEIVN
jgi:hypothetical protein